MSTTSARVRQTWRSFELWHQHKQSTALNPQLSQSDADAQKDYKKLSQSERSNITLKQYKTQRRLEIEKNFYAGAREEWQKRLAKAGLKDEDWGEMTDAETRAVETALGAHVDLDASGSGDQPSGSGSGEVKDTPTLNDDREESSLLALVPTAPKLFAPSLSTSSSISSYELVNPSELVSDDDGDDDGERFFSSIVSSHDLTPEDEDPSILNPSWRTLDPLGAGSTSASRLAVNTNIYSNPHAYTQTHSAFSSTSNYNWSTDSSRHNSANGSPTHLGLNFKSFPFDTAPPIGTTGGGSSRLFDPSYTASSIAASISGSSASASYAATKPTKPKLTHSSSASTSVWTPPSASSAINGSVTSTASTSASASASTALVKPKSASPSTSSKSSLSLVSNSATSVTSASASAPSSSYIGPLLLESDSEDAANDHDPSKDPTLTGAQAEAEALDFERFKFETRITKIIEFHRAAAEMEIKLGLEICKMRLRFQTRDQPPPSAGVLVKFGSNMNKGEKDEERRLVMEHEQAMKRLQAEKEDERKVVVKEERRRRRMLLQQRQLLNDVASSAAAGKSAGKGPNDPSWLDEYDTVQATFEVDRPSLDGVFGSVPQTQPRPPVPATPGLRAPSTAAYGKRPMSRLNGKAPASPEVQIARPRPLPAAWGQIPYIPDDAEEEEEEERDGEYGEYDYENRYDRGGYEYEYEYQGDHQGQRHYAPPTHHQYQPQSHQQEAFIPRHVYDDDLDHRQPQRGQGQGYSYDSYQDEDVPEDFRRAMSEFGLGTSGGYSSSSSLDLDGNGGGGGGGGYANAVDVGSGYASDTMGTGYASDAMGSYAHRGPSSLSSMPQGGEMGYGHGHGTGMMPGSMSMSPSSSMSVPGGLGGMGLGSSPVDMATPRVASHPWSAASNGAGLSAAANAMMSKTPTKSSPLAARAGANPFSAAATSNGNGKSGVNGSAAQARQQQQQQHQQNLDANGNGQSAAATHASSSIASTLTSGVGAWAAKKFSLFGGASSEQPQSQPTQSQSQSQTQKEKEKFSFDEDPEEGEEEEGEEEEEDVPPPPPPPVTVGKGGKKGKNAPAPPPPPPAATTTAKGKKGAAGKAAANKTNGKAAAEKASPPPPPPPVEKEKPVEKPAPAPPAKETPAPAPVAPGKKGKKGRQAKKAAASTKAAPVEPEPEPTPPSPPVPAVPAKEQPKSKVSDDRGAHFEDDGMEDGEEDEDALYGMQQSTMSSKTVMSSSGVWGEASSTPRPASKAVPAGAWGNTNHGNPVQNLAKSELLNGGGSASGTPRPSMLRKQIYQQHQQQQQRQMMTDHEQDEDGHGHGHGVLSGAAKGGSTASGGRMVIDNSPLPASVAESLWTKARSAIAAGAQSTPTPAAVGAGAVPSAKGGWKSNTNAPSRLGSVSVFDSVDEGDKPVTSTPANVVRKGGAAAANGKRKAGGGPPKKVTIEEVSDEEDGVLDNSLPLTYRSIMEPKSPDPNVRTYNIPDFSNTSSPSTNSSSSNVSSPNMPHVRQPKPSAPPGVFSNLFDYDTQQQHYRPSQRDHDEDGFFSSSSMTTPATTAPTSPEDGSGMSPEFMMEAAKQLNGQAPGRRLGGGLDAGFSTDWEGTVKPKRGTRWGGAPAQTTSSSSSSSAASAARYKSVMSEDETGGHVPGGFPRGGAGTTSMSSIWEAKQQQQQQQLAAVAQKGALGKSAWGVQGTSAAGSASASSTSLSPRTSEDSSGGDASLGEADDLYARFAKSQQLEAMKRTKMANGGGKLF